VLVSQAKEDLHFNDLVASYSEDVPFNIVIGRMHLDFLQDSNDFMNLLYSWPQ
jgi:hypothetical protein